MLYLHGLARMLSLSVWCVASGQDAVGWLIASSFWRRFYTGTSCLGARTRAFTGAGVGEGGSITHLFIGVKSLDHSRRDNSRSYCLHNRIINTNVFGR